MDNYQKYRGKCKEYSKQLVEQNSELILVRGWYHCPVWGREEHWWTKHKAVNLFACPKCGTVQMKRK